MSSNNYGQKGLDTSRMSRTQLEVLGQIAFKTNRVSGFLPHIVGSFLDAILLGIIAVTWMLWLFQARPTERRWIRYIMYFVVFSVVGNSVVVRGAVLNVFARSSGEYKVFFEVTWHRWQGLATCANRVPPSIFFINRAYTLMGKKKWFLFAVAPLLQVACDIVLDLSLTATISVQLYRSKTGWRNTDALIERLIWMVAQCQAPTTIMAIIFGAIYLFMPNSTATIALNSVSKLHVLCMIITLLARIRVQRELQSGGSGNQHSKSMPSTPQQSGDSHLSGVSGVSQGSQVQDVVLYEGARDKRASVREKAMNLESLERLV